LNKAFLYAACITIIVTPLVYVLDQVGKKKHRKILSSKLFQHLLAEGFQVEEQGEYRGLIGERNQQPLEFITTGTSCPKDLSASETLLSLHILNPGYQL
jgi:hypothetical protein